MIFNKLQLNKLYRYCYALTVDRDKAYDLLQASIEKFLKAPTVSISSELSFLRRIAHNHFIDTVRKEKLITYEQLNNDFLSNNDAISIDSNALDNMLINQELIEFIWSILNVDEREIIFLWAVEGYTAHEIAIELKIARGTVLSKIHRLRKKIESKLSQKDEKARNKNVVTT